MRFVKVTPSLCWVDCRQSDEEAGRGVVAAGAQPAQQRAAQRQFDRGRRRPGHRWSSSEDSVQASPVGTTWSVVFFRCLLGFMLFLGNVYSRFFRLIRFSLLPTHRLT